MAVHILKWIKGWRLDKIFVNKDESLKSAVAHAVILLDKVRSLTESPTMEAILATIPGDWDAKLVEAVKNILPKVVDSLTTNSLCLDKPSFEEKLSCVLANIAGNPDETGRATAWHSIASFIAVEFKKVISDGRFDINDIFMLVADGYREFIVKKK